MENNFKCPKTGKEFFISSYTLGFRNGDKIYKDKQGNQLVNEENGEPLEYIDKNKGFCTNYAKVSSMSPQDKKKALKQRSKKHSQSSEVRDKIGEMNSNAHKNAKGIG